MTDHDLQKSCQSFFESCSWAIPTILLKIEDLHQTVINMTMLTTDNQNIMTKSNL